MKRRELPEMRFDRVPGQSEGLDLEFCSRSKRTLKVCRPDRVGSWSDFYTPWFVGYGVNFIGSIKALTGSLMFFSTALATSIFGILIDLGYSIENIAILCSIYTALSIIIVLIFQKTYKPVFQNKTSFYLNFS